MLGFFGPKYHPSSTLIFTFGLIGVTAFRITQQLKFNSTNTCTPKHWSTTYHSINTNSLSTMLHTSPLSSLDPHNVEPVSQLFHFWWYKGLRCFLMRIPLCQDQSLLVGHGIATGSCVHMALPCWLEPFKRFVVCLKGKSCPIRYKWFPLLRLLY